MIARRRCEIRMEPEEFKW